MEVDNMALTPASLSQLFLSNNSHGQFKLPSAKAITITGQSCTQGACTCGNTGSLTSKGYSAWGSVCSFVGSCSARGNCCQPVMLSGDCCAFCGALVNATADGTFRRNQFEASVKKYVGTQSYKIAVSSGSQVQVLLTGSKAVILVDELAADMREVPASYTLPTTPTLAVQKSIAQKNPVQVVTVLPYETDEGGQVVTDAAGKPVPSECQPSGRSEKNTGGNSGSSRTTYHGLWWLRSVWSFSSSLSFSLFTTSPEKDEKTLSTGLRRTPSSCRAFISTARILTRLAL